MIRASLLIFVAAACATAQPASDSTKQGEQIFAKTCSIGYCHGARGSAGGAPRLVSRGFSGDFIRRTVTTGVPGTAMPAFSHTLAAAELNAVVAYVASLNGIGPAGAAAKAKLLSGEPERGRVLFYDAVRSFGRCATCHEVNGVGIPVAAPIAKAPADASALKSLVTPRVGTAKFAGESMPALVVSRGKTRTTFFDLTAAPPVQRIADTANVEVSEGSSWKHSSFIGVYNDTELSAIVAFLKAVAQ